jgi:putative chitinase
MLNSIPTTINLSALKGHVPDSVYQELPTIFTRFGIDGPKRLSHLMGQAAHESANFTAIRENLNYSADGLTKVFKKYFPTIASTVGYAKVPEKIANKVYASRMSNGDEASGDGWRYRGRGFIQLTGRSNYKALGEYLTVDLLATPDLVATEYPLTSAAFFFMSNKLWSICDAGTDIETITRVTRRVNGGTHGIDQRITLTQRYHKLLTT